MCYKIMSITNWIIFIEISYLNRGVCEEFFKAEKTKMKWKMRYGGRNREKIYI